MPINMSDAIDGDTSVPIVIFRQGEGMYSGTGKWVAGTIKKIPALMSLQPASAQQLKDAGVEFNTKSLAFWCNKILRISDPTSQTVSDIVYYKKRYYKLSSLFNWEEFGYSTGIVDLKERTDGSEVG